MTVPWTGAADVVAAVCLTTGALLTLIAAIGLVRFPDLLSRMHSVTKPQVLGLLLLIIGLALRLRDPSAIGVLLLVAVAQLAHRPGVEPHAQPRLVPGQTSAGGPARRRPAHTDPGHPRGAARSALSAPIRGAASGRSARNPHALSIRSGGTARVQVRRSHHHLEAGVARRRRAPAARRIVSPGTITALSLRCCWESPLPSLAQEWRLPVAMAGGAGRSGPARCGRGTRPCSS
jgi:monovalent cation/proton antiporter MnhG/PhaG subunit